MPNEERPEGDIVEGWLQLEAGYFLGDCFVAMYEPEALTVCAGESAIAADDSARSFLPKHTACMPLPVLQAILKAHGLRVIGPAEAAVLDAIAEAPDSFIQSMERSCEGPDVWVAWMLKVLRAELARRQQPPEKERE